jgi:Family of unknown function (DUF6114)
VLSHGALRLVVYIGIAGVFGVLIGVLLITAGVAVWVSPAHRSFYGVAGVVLGLASFLASNLGGFFICLLLAIIGGAVVFAWTPGSPDSAPDSAVAPAPDERLTAEPPTIPDPVSGPDPSQPAGEPPQASSGPARGGWPLAAVAAPLAVLAGLAAGHPAAPAASAAGSRPAQTCILGIICFGGGSASPAPSPSATYSLPTCLPTALPSPLPTSLASLPTTILKKLQSLPTCVTQALPALPGLPTSLPTPSIPGLPSPAPGAPSSPGAPSDKPGSPAPKAKTAGTDGGLVAPAAISVITAGSATMTGFTYQGNAKLPTASGGTVTMMMFTASSLTLSGNVADAVTEAGHTATTSSPVMAFKGNVVLYATKLSGTLAGIPLTFTPTTISGLLLKVANVITSNGTITMTNVTTNQATGTADSLTYGPGGSGFSVVLQ